MTKAYLAKQIKEFEKSLCKSPSDNLEWLMEKAAEESAKWLYEKYPNSFFIILCGPGNNGGDGYCIANELVSIAKVNAPKNPISIRIIDVMPSKQKSALCKSKSENHTFQKIDHKFLKKCLEDVYDEDNLKIVIVDSIFGIGGRVDLPARVEKIIKTANLFYNKIAIDISTGLNSNTGEISKVCFNASSTVTFLGLKLGQLINQGKIYSGDIVLKDLGFNMNKIVKPAVHEFSYKDIKSKLPVRKKDAHKRNHGKLLIVAGDEGYGGAGILTSETALKTGTGLVKLLTRKSHVSPSLAKNPEVMVCGADNAQDLEQNFLWSDVFVCGPGMFENYWSEQLLYKLITYAEKNRIPTLLDAGALRLLTKEPFTKMALPKDIILTPHPGEASSLLGITTEKIQKNRLKAAKDLHVKFGGIIVLKGHGTVIHDGEESYLSSSGGPELAVAGSGDILSGVIGSLMAQGLQPLDAAVAGVALHSNAGDSFAKEIGNIGLAASELIPHIRNALN